VTLKRCLNMVKHLWRYLKIIQGFKNYGVKVICDREIDGRIDLTNLDMQLPYITMWKI